MSMDVIVSIKQTELEAQEIIKESHSEAQRLLRQQR